MSSSSNIQSTIPEGQDIVETTVVVTDNYAKLKEIYIGKEVRSRFAAHFQNAIDGKVPISIIDKREPLSSTKLSDEEDKQEEPEVYSCVIDVNYNRVNGQQFKYFWDDVKLQVGDELKFTVISSSNSGHLLFLLKTLENQSTTQNSVEKGDKRKAPVTIGEVKATVLDRLNAKHILLEKFKLSNYEDWSPENEIDVYHVFGMLESIHGLSYVVGLSKRIQNQLGYKLKQPALSSPDAILVDNSNMQYLVAEFEKTSSGFIGKHNKEDVDILVCWVDDVDSQEKRSELPDRILELKTEALKMHKERIATSD